MRRAYAAIAVAIVGVSFASIFLLWSESHPVTKALYRMAFTTLILLPLALTLGLKDLRRLHIRDMAIISAVGVILAAHFAFWITSLNMTSVASSVVLVNSHPILVGLSSHYILRERISWITSLGIALGLGGIGLLAFGDYGRGGESLDGDGLAFLGGVMSALYILSGRKIRQRIPLLPYVFVLYLSTTMSLLLSSIAAGIPLAPASNFEREITLFLALAIVSTIFGHTLYNWSLKYVAAPVVSMSLLGEPIGASILAFIFFAQQPGVMTLVGGGLALMGVYLATKGGAMEAKG